MSAKCMPGLRKTMVAGGLKPLTAGEAGFDFVPVFDLFGFAKLPAEQDDATLAHVWKIDEAASVVF